MFDTQTTARILRATQQQEHMDLSRPRHERKNRYPRSPGGSAAGTRVQMGRRWWHGDSDAATTSRDTDLRDSNTFAIVYGQGLPGASETPSFLTVDDSITDVAETGPITVATEGLYGISMATRRLYTDISDPSSNSIPQHAQAGGEPQIHFNGNFVYVEYAFELQIKTSGSAVWRAVNEMHVAHVGVGVSQTPTHLTASTRVIKLFEGDKLRLWRTPIIRGKAATINHATEFAFSIPSALDSYTFTSGAEVDVEFLFFNEAADMTAPTAAAVPIDETDIELKLTEER